MNNSSSASNPSGPTSAATTTKQTHIHKNNNNKNTIDNTITINEKINLTKKQHEILNTICNSYGMSISKYIQEALVQTMRSDIEDGDLSDVLLDKLDEDDNNNNKSHHPPSAPNTANER
jgi:anti-sigma28 factor (negative regulator of flagellin synthesis)